MFTIVAAEVAAEVAMYIIKAIAGKPPARKLSWYILHEYYLSCIHSRFTKALSLSTVGVICAQLRINYL